MLVDWKTPARDDGFAPNSLWSVLAQRVGFSCLVCAWPSFSKLSFSRAAAAAGRFASLLS
jgi:hypothetical protein